MTRITLSTEKVSYGLKVYRGKRYLGIIDESGFHPISDSFSADEIQGISQIMEKEDPVDFKASMAITMLQSPCEKNKKLRRRDVGV